MLLDRQNCYRRLSTSRHESVLVFFFTFYICCDYNLKNHLMYIIFVAQRLYSDVKRQENVVCIREEGREQQIKSAVCIFFLNVTV